MDVPVKMNQTSDVYTCLRVPADLSDIAYSRLVFAHYAVFRFAETENCNTLKIFHRR
jgi:uncharacterized protein (DUF1919 family)